MIKYYVVEGMTCGGCVNSVAQNINDLPMVDEATVTLDPPLLTVVSDMPLPIGILSQSVGAKYTLTESVGQSINPSSVAIEATDIAEVSLQTYFPLILIVSFILGVVALSQYPFDDFSAMLLMRHFMAGFFIVFSFFKLLNVSGFAASYSMYDVIASRWKAWGFIYPFVELGLGALYLTDTFSTYTHILTIVILTIGTVGVAQSIWTKQKIKCACLGDVFNLPMSTVTIIENTSMIAMAIAMLVLG